MQYALEHLQLPSWRRPARYWCWGAVASLISITIGACQTQPAARLPGGSREACAERARQEAPDKRMGEDRQRDRWFIYRACMHESGLKA